MEPIFFELQLCIAILIFKEKSNFGYTDHPEITTSLCHVFVCVSSSAMPAAPDLQTLLQPSCHRDYSHYSDESAGATWMPPMTSFPFS